MTKNMILNFKKNKGFTLMEVIIAIGVISVGSIGLLALMDFSIRANSISSNRLIASNLAQEGIEVIRFNRDHAADWDAWYSGFNDGDYRVGIQTVSPYTWSLEFNPASYRLYYNNVSGLYNHIGAGNASIFTRKIIVNTLSATEKQIIADIQWSERGKNHSLIIEDRLHNWKPTW
ncbi:prepilin-type N-terminal cleavage/methylation domain-containing protein [Patescibacteria group bacterium]